MVTKEKVAGGVMSAAAATVFLWPDLTYYVVGAFYLITFGMLAADRPRGEMFPPPDIEEPRGLYWRLQPRWVKVVAIWAGVPVWLFFVREISLPSEEYNPIWLGAFGAIVMLELVFIARAYWRMDI